MSASFIAYAPNYIQKINDFSSDISTASLDLGTKIMLPDSQSKGKDSVDLIRDSLFSIQVEKPWLLLQFGNSDTEEIGADRVEALVSASPSDEDGETRENVVKTEIEDNDNDNLTIPQVVNRLGMVFFLLIFNLGITIFIFLLTGMMLFSQILFIIYAMFLPVSFLLSMIPTYENMAKQAVVRVFNAIMTRAGITLIVTVAFSISSMFYNISTDYPFFMVAFLQIICFAGIYMKLGELMSMFSLNANDSQQIGCLLYTSLSAFLLGAVWEIRLSLLLWKWRKEHLQVKKIRSYTSIWNVEKVLYAINDVNLPFPVTFTQITWFVLTEFIIILFADVPPLSMIEGAFLK